MRKNILITLLLASFFLPSFAGIKEGKEIFFSRKGTYGTCATCHPGGGTAGKWDAKTKTIGNIGKKIPDLHGISSRRTLDQTRRLASLYAKEFEIKLSAAEIEDVVMWLYMANK